MIIMIDGELKSMLKDQAVLEALYIDSEALIDLETSYRIMLEKELVDEFMKRRFDKILNK